MRRTLPLIAWLALTAGCIAPSDTPASPEGLVVRAGTSFGMCVGYCLTELRIESDEVLLVESSRSPEENPPRSQRAALEPAEWDQIAALARPDVLEGLQEVYGCPDCADGGAEWIEVELDGVRRRVTFEHGATVEPIQPLIEKARELRTRLAPAR